MPSFRFVVPDGAGSGRLDKFVADSCDGMNRSKLKSGLSSLLLNGKPSKLSAKVRPGDVVEFGWEDSVPDNIEPEDIPLKVIYEDDDVTVVDKAQGMVTHPAGGNWTGTLVSALLFRWGRGTIENVPGGGAERLRPGIVHRLDKDTSGVIITARNRASEEWLHAQFSDHRLLRKEYVAICTGCPPSRAGRIDSWIARDPGDRKKFRAVPAGGSGRSALTLYQCVAVYTCGGETYSLFRVRIKTGRTHQIRVHLKSIGCPVLGDPLYGKAPGSRSTFRSATLMLHARMLGIRLPGARVPSEFRADYPVRFRKVMKVLHERFRKN